MVLGGGASSFYGNGKKGRNFKPADAPPRGVCRFALPGSIICRQAVLCACRGSCMGEGSLKFRVPRERSEPQNALFQASFSLLKNLGSPLQRPPSYESSAPCSILHALLDHPSHSDSEALMAGPHGCFLVLLLGEPKECCLSQG